MKISDAYLPHQIFLGPHRSGQPTPRVFISPQRYVQGVGVLDGTGRYLSLLDSRRAGVLITRRGERNEGVRLIASLKAHEIDAVVSPFGGECSLEEIAARVEHRRSSTPAGRTITCTSFPRWPRRAGSCRTRSAPGGAICS